MAFSIFNGKLTNAFQPTAPFGVVGENIVFDMALTVANIAVPGTPATIQWYPEFTSADPNNPATVWFREVAEEDLGNGDVRMSKVIRRFAENGSDAPLAEGLHYLDGQFARRHNFCRLQLAVKAGGADNCSASVLAVFGIAQPLSAP